MTVRWRIYDLGREYHGAPTTSTDGRQGPPERRYFTAGVDDDARPWTPDHRYTLEVAQKIIVWKNAWVGT